MVSNQAVSPTERPSTKLPVDPRLSGAVFHVAHSVAACETSGMTASTHARTGDLPFVAFSSDLRHDLRLPWISGALLLVVHLDYEEKPSRLVLLHNRLPDNADP